MISKDTKSNAAVTYQKSSWRRSLSVGINRHPAAVGQGAPRGRTCFVSHGQSEVGRSQTEK